MAANVSLETLLPSTLAPEAAVVDEGAFSASDLSDSCGCCPAAEVFSWDDFNELVDAEVVTVAGVADDDAFCGG